jgi:hypothetical protein
MEKIVCNHITPLYSIFPTPKASAAIGQNDDIGSGKNYLVRRKTRGEFGN